MRSCLVEAEVSHRRLRKGEEHAFQHKVFYALVDLDELPQLERELRLFRQGDWGIYSLGVHDFINFGLPTIKANILAWLKQRGFNKEVQRVNVLCHLRSFGYNFNPIALIMLETRDGTYCVAEVNNTFGEAKLYFLGQLVNGHLVSIQAKDYYVSPFIEHDAEFIFEVKQTTESLSLSVTTRRQGETILFAGMQGRYRTLSDSYLLRYLLMLPLTPLKVVGAIHWHAFKLFLKRVPYFKKGEFTSQQRDYYAHKAATHHVT